MLRRLFAAVLCLGALASTAAAAKDAPTDAAPKAVKVGDPAPKFAALDDAGKKWNSDDHVGKKILVVYFYPADMTPGCTKQACGYRDAAKEFKDKDVEVIGVSGDSVENHQVFKREHDLNFTLLADPEGKVAKAFGVKIAPGGGEWTFNQKADGKPLTLKRDLTAMRWTFVIDRDGRIAHKDDAVDAAKDPTTILIVVEKLSKKQDDKSGA